MYSQQSPNFPGYLKWLLGIAAMLMVAFISHVAPPPGLITNTPVGAYMDGNLPATSPNNPGTYTVVEAFPNLSFNGVSVIVSAPTGNSAHALRGKMIVGTATGMLYVFDTTTTVLQSQVNTLLDWTTETLSRGENSPPNSP